MSTQHTEQPHGPEARHHSTGGASLEALRRDLEELGLSTYEARVLLALLHLGSAAPGQLARDADVPRTSTYQILEELQAKGLAERVPTRGPAVWTSRGLDEVMDRLTESQEALFRQHQARADRLRTMLEAALPEAGDAPPLPCVHVIHEPARVRPHYERLLKAATSELLVFSRPPYNWEMGLPNPAVLEAAGRLTVRILYQEAQVLDPAGAMWRQEMASYHAAGAEGRVVDSLPSKLAVMDRRTALVSLDNPAVPDAGFPTSLVVEHPGFAAMQVDAFERRWEDARPYEAVLRNLPDDSSGHSGPR